MGRRHEGEPISEASSAKKRINLQVSGQVTDEIEKMARELGCTPTGLARHLIKFGLHCLKTSRDEGGIYFQEPGKEREKVYLDFM